MTENIDYEKYENADRERVQEPSLSRVEILNNGKRQAEKDREACYGTQSKQLQIVNQFPACSRVVDVPVLLSIMPTGLSKPSISFSTKFDCGRTRASLWMKFESAGSL